MKVPMSSPDLGEAERRAVAEVLQTPRLSIGPQLQAFEGALGRYVGAKHAIATSSGTASLHLCVAAAGLGEGDLVITTPFSFVASCNVLLYERAIPIFVDVLPESGNLDPELAAAAAADLASGGSAAARWLPPRARRSGELKALLAVDVFGQPAAYDQLQEVSDRHGLALIEDSAEALGSEYHGRKAGTLGHAGVFGFYPNKQITTGEGGAVVTDRDDWAERIRALRNQGRAETDTWLKHTYLGYNYRMHELSAALGAAQLGRVEQLLRRRQRVSEWYRQRLQTVSGVNAPRLLPSTTSMSWFVYVVQLEPGVDRQAVVGELLRLEIPSRAYFEPIHLQPYMLERFGYAAGAFPVAEDLGRRCLALPFSGVMTEAQVELVCDSLAKALGGL